MPRPSVKDQREHELVQAAIRCVARRGLQNTTITDVADDAGMSRGIISFYFTSKDALIEKALDSLLEGFAVSALKKAETADGPAAALEAFWQAHFLPGICSQKRMNVWLEYAGAATSNKAFAQCFAQYRSRWQEQLVRLAFAAGRSELAQGQSAAFTQLCGLWMRCALEGVPQSLEQARQEWQQHLHGTQPMPPAQPARASAKPAAKPERSQLALGDLFALNR